jgi:coenzyme F420 hydrogenase subunit delta
MEYVPEIYKKKVIALGCGNILFGDDGFGPAVTEYMNSQKMVPQYAEVMNAGTSVRKLLFDITLSEKRPKVIVIIDAVDCGRVPGEIFDLAPDEIPFKKLDDFSMHQIPTSNLLLELKNLCGVDVRIIACQVAHIPESVSPGLSATVQAAVPVAADIVMRIISKV